MKIFLALGIICNLMFGTWFTGESIAKQNKPKIKIVKVSKYNDDEGNVWGRVKGKFNPDKYGVAVYIKMIDGRWWTKPYSFDRVSPIDSNGHWKCDITTGGKDKKATAVMVFLIKKSFKPPNLSGKQDIFYNDAFPLKLKNKSIDYVFFGRGCNKKPPKIKILYPKNNQVFELGEKIRFRSKIKNIGKWYDRYVIWNSNVDGEFGFYSSKIALDSLSLGKHTISVSVFDKCDVMRTKKIHIFIEENMNSNE